MGVLFYELAVPKIGGHGEARVVTTKVDIQGGIKSALDAYKSDNGHFPRSLHDLVQQPSGDRNWHGTYFYEGKLPVDPWGNPYIYHCPGKHKPDSYDLLSVGPDGKEGTDDDIGNWMN